MQPRIIRVRRLVISEVDRFPELGLAFYEQGPGRIINALAETFERLTARGLLYCDDPLVAATHFNWLIMSQPLNRAMFLHDAAVPDLAELQRWADGGAHQPFQLGAA